MAVLRRIIQAVAVLVAALALAALATATLRTGPAPSVEFLAVPSAIGPSAPVRVVARAGGRGLAGLRLELEQKGKVQVVARREHRPAPAWNPLGAATRQDEIQADVGTGRSPA
jgi:hypothetical protein